MRSAGNIFSALRMVNSFRCRGGGEGRISVARLLSPSGMGLASRCSLSRMEAALRLMRFLK